MKLLFLDFDGVLNSSAYFLKAEGNPSPPVSWQENQIDPEAVQRLNVIIEATDARIVVSSTWRLGSSRGQLRDLLCGRGLRKNWIIGTTPDFFSRPVDGYPAIRGGEIAWWMDDQRAHGKTIESFAILDDDADMGALTPRLVKTSFYDGLQDKHVREVVRLLNTPVVW